MDPLTIAGAAASASKLLYSVCDGIFKVYSFAQATKEVDQSVGDLQNQVAGCAKVLDALSAALNNPYLGDVASHNRELWQNIDGSIESCRATIVNLLVKMDGIKDSKSSTFLQAWRQFKLDFIQEDLDAFLSSLRGHSMNLQLSMTLVNVLVCANSPEVITKDHALRFEKLEKMLVVIDSRLNAPSINQRLPLTDCIGPVSLDENTVNLRRSADSVMSSTVAARSVCEEFKTPLPSTNEPAFDYINADKEASAFSQSEIFSTTGSEYGTPLTTSNRARIQDWREAGRIDDVSEEGSTANKTQTATSMFDESSLISEPDITEEIHEIFDESSDDEINYEIVQSLLSKAGAYFSNEQFDKAESCLRRAFEESRHFSAKRRDALQIQNKRLTLAICCLHLGKLVESEELLLLAAKEPMRNAEDAQRVFEALHNLSRLQLMRRNVDAALIHCRQALRGRRKAKSIGKGHQDYFQSLRLLGLIYWAKGDSVQADACIDLLPVQQRLSPSDFQDVLNNEFPYQEDLTSRGKSEETVDNITHAKDASPSQQTSHDAEDFSQTISSTSISPVTSSATSPTMSPAVLPTVSRAISTGDASLTARALSPIRTAGAASATTKSDIKAAMMQPYQRETGNRITQEPSIAEGVISDNSPSQPEEIAGLTLDERESFTSSRPSELRQNSSAQGERLIQAISQGDDRLVSLLLQSKLRKQTPLDINSITEEATSKPPLIVAVERNNFQMSKLLLSHQTDVNAKSSDGKTALIVSASQNYVQICELLLNHGAFIDERDANEMTALMHASSAGHYDVCHCLIRAGANIRFFTKQGDNAYSLASEEKTKRLIGDRLNEPLTTVTGSHESSEETMSKSRQDEQPQTMKMEVDAAQASSYEPAPNQDLSITNPEVEKRLKIDISDLLALLPSPRLDLTEPEKRFADKLIEKKGFNKHGKANKGLLWAVRNDYPTVLVSLLKRPDADVNTRDSGFRSSNNTLIQVAMAHRKWAICERLIYSGANLNEIYGPEKTLLGYAAEHGTWELCLHLLMNGACVNDDDKFYKQAALSRSIRRGEVRICRVLIAYDAHVDPTDPRYMDTLLYEAALYGHAAVCKLLISVGADPHFTRRDGKTCLMIASEFSSPQTCQLFIEQGVNIDQRDEKGRTALMYAASWGSVEVCRLLLSNGADTSIRDCYKKTCRDLARTQPMKDLFPLEELGPTEA